MMSNKSVPSQSSDSAISYPHAKNRLQTFANLTVGLASFPRIKGKLPSHFASVAGFPHKEYDLGFVPSSATRDGKYHKLKLEIVGAYGGACGKGHRWKAIVYAREGYVAAKEPARH